MILAMIISYAAIAYIHINTFADPDDDGPDYERDARWGDVWQAMS